MSINLMSLVFKCNMPTLKTDKGATVSDSSAKFVLLALADHASDEGEGAYPGVKALCRKTNLSTQTVVNALNALRFNGFTQLEGQSKRKTFNYSILVARILEFQWVVSSDSSHQNATIPVARVNPSSNHPSNHTKQEDDDALALVSKLYSENVGEITPMTADLLRDVAETYPKEWIEPAFRTAAEHNARSMAYVMAILNGWKLHGFQAKNGKPAQKGKGGQRVKIREDETQEQREARVSGAIARLYKTA